MLPTRSSLRRPLLAFFVASCTISALSSLFFYAWFGRTAGAVFLQPGLLFSSVLADGVGAMLVLALLVPLRSAGPGPFWACGIGVVVVVWPPLSDLASAAFERAAGGQAPAQANWNLHDWFYSLLHTPDDLVLVSGSALLLALTAWIWPARRSAGTAASGRHPGSAEGRSGPLSVREMLFSFHGRLNRRPYIVAALALGLPNIILQGLAPAWLALVVQIALFWPLLALAAKRAHDRGHGTAWIVYMAGLPGVFGILLQMATGPVFASPDPSTLKLVISLDLLITLPVLWALVEFVALRGERGANRYGPDRLATDSQRPAGAAPVMPANPKPATVTPFASLPSRITAEAAARFRRRLRKK